MRWSQPLVEDCGRHGRLGLGLCPARGFRVPAALRDVRAQYQQSQQFPGRGALVRDSECAVDDPRGAGQILLGVGQEGGPKKCSWMPPRWTTAYGLGRRCRKVTSKPRGVEKSRTGSRVRHGRIGTVDSPMQPL
ncbi:hypothetical protein AN217_09230 [Streptomyces qinglanensis]|uniref:Uncharacterized protein n=1 Tax=Streptomyces qinglanensis TaxID=943816 RepID=A0A1E7K266_9ACTN|nr:hypothetical protein AN217_09230 [Streptomyces qinglanensis]OEV24865.1 hypothetical protein AN220_17005 [Streptomyces nanshensis]